MPGENGLELLVQVAAPQHAVGEVRSIERPDEHQRVVQLKFADDVVTNPLGGGRGECVEGCARKVLAHATELAVLRPEVVSPLADAVRFIDGDEPHAELAEDPAEALAAVADEPLWRHIQQATAVLTEARHHRVALARALGAVQVRSFDAIDAQPVDLILHQRDQRRDDQRETLTACS